MRIKIQFITTLIAAITLFCCCSTTKSSESSKDAIPTLDEVSGVWIASDTLAIEPSIRNFRGQALLNRDMTSISWFVSAPYSGGHHTGIMKINGEIPKASLFRWQPYQALRRGEVKGLEVNSSTRMMVENNAIMWSIEIKNTTDSSKITDIELDMIGNISEYKEGTWNWWYPYPDWKGNRSESRDLLIEEMRKNITNNLPKDKISWPTDKEVLNSDFYSANVEENTIYIKDKKTPAISAYSLATIPDKLTAMNAGGKASWKCTLKPGESKEIKYILTYGNNLENIKESSNKWASKFDTEFSKVKSDWESKWDEIFTPNNKLLSGCFPTLETNDEIVKRVYYMGPLTMLYLLNTNLPQHKRVYLTGGPRWGASTTFFWDIAIWSDLWAVVDPQMMKEQITTWVGINPNAFYGQDNLNGKGVGNGYSANYWCLFKIIRDYLVTTGDYAFLDEKIGDKTLLEHLETYSLNWKNLSNYGKPGYEDELYKLADFGGNAANLLECVPTYIHIVPSFNIGYIWMMREVATIYQERDNGSKAAELNKYADDMTKVILKLYSGNGAWSALHPNNKKVEVRHVLDFIYFGKFLANDVSPKIKEEMMEFFNRELRTNSWMRAQSLSDIAADYSDRPDHGPLGSFDGWIPEAMDAMTEMGYSEDAFKFYKDIEPVTYEGGWAQARELWGENKNNKNARVRIAERGWNNRESSSGIGISKTVIKNFFGFKPQFNKNPMEDLNSWPFSGDSKLHHVYYRGDYYTIKFENNKPTMIIEN